jgi:hypothetical protein
MLYGVMGNERDSGRSGDRGALLPLHAPIVPMLRAFRRGDAEPALG